MNQAELNALNTAIHNDAKLLYCIGIRALADEHHHCTLDYKKLIGLLNGKEHNYQRGRQINQLIDQLITVGLLAFNQADVDKQRTYNGKQLTLLLRDSGDEYTDLHSTWQTMQPQWTPNKALVESLSQLTGLINTLYTKQDVGEFVAYWLGRPEKQFSLFQWTQKFVFHLKTQRTVSTTNRHIIGTQAVNKTTGISISSNTKKLVEKYHGKNHKTD